ncbi:MAG: hypothetical protein H7A21_00820 [Spirochaetales bacterium]|nr:hypothetical protein [Spirochaetales bacterium]
MEANRRSQLACESALDQLKALDQFNATVGEAIGVVGVLDAIDIRIGIHTGEVVAGNMGSETARNFTIMGDSVNWPRARRVPTSNTDRAFCSPRPPWLKFRASFCVNSI